MLSMSASKMLLSQKISALILFFVVRYSATGQRNFTDGPELDHALTTSPAFSSPTSSTITSVENTFFDLDEISKWSNVTEGPEIDSGTTTSTAFSSPTPSTITTVENTFFDLDEITKWNILLSHSLNVVRFMVCEINRPTQNMIRQHAIFENRKNRKSYVFIYTNELAKFTPGFEEVLSCSGTAPTVITWALDVLSDDWKLEEVLLRSLDLEEDVRGVLVASSYVDFIQLIFEIVTSNVQFKWRRLFHATEWFVLTIDQILRSSPILNHTNLPDFMTVTSAEEFHLEIKQKSRKQQMRTVLELDLTPIILYSIPHKDVRTNSSSRILNYTRERHKPTTPPKLRNDTFMSQNLRKDAMSYLFNQKSVMADMRIPAVVVASRQMRTAFLKDVGNTTRWAGFNIDLLNVLSEYLGFTHEPFPVCDGGFYGVFHANGEILGITGYLARREAGLTPMGMSTSQRRLDVIDFIYSSIRNEPFYIMYKINFGNNQLGDPRSELVDTREDLIFVLIGPCIVLVVGLFVFLVSGVFLTSEKIYGRENLRRIYDFPLQWMFQTTENCPHQSGRILRASWGLFCVAMFASYGALLTTNATAPPEYPTITSIEDLLHQPNFKIGTSLSNSHFITTMEEAAEGTTMGHLWRVMSVQNKSDHGTFRVDRAFHIRRVLEGDYAFLDDTPLGLVPSIVDADYTDVRFAKLYNIVPKMAVPEDAFYVRDLELALKTITEMGILDALAHKWYPPKASLKRSKVEYDQVVKLFRLEFLFYIVVIGLGVGALSLAAECAVRLNNCFTQRFSNSYL